MKDEKEMLVSTIVEIAKAALEVTPKVEMFMEGNCCVKIQRCDDGRYHVEVGAVHGCFKDSCYFVPDWESSLINYFECNVKIGYNEAKGYGYTFGYPKSYQHNLLNKVPSFIDVYVFGYSTISYLDDDVMLYSGTRFHRKRS